MSSHIANGQNGATTAVQQPSTSVQRIPVAVEVARTPDQTRFWQQQQQKRSLHDDVRALAAAGSLLIQAGYLTVPASLRGVVLYIRCLIPSDLCDPNVVLPFSSVDLTIHVYTLTDEADELEELQPDGDEEAEAPVIGGTTTTLPHKKFDDLWENLYYDEHIKNDVLEYSATALEMAQHGVPTSIVSCNRLILLHGPPGTGKTTLCQAIAHKLCCTSTATYTHGKLIEINSHSLFSKFFSESGKLVQKLFAQITADLEDDPKQLYCVLIDEVESIASSRTGGGSDPQDAIRAGNALLTQLDRLKRYPNVLLLCTSNLTAMIDSAFSDRVDLKIYIGPPNTEARYEILRSQIEALLPSSAGPTGVPPATNFGLRLRAVAQGCDGCGGRILRRVPVRCIQLFKSRHRGRAVKMTVGQYLEELPGVIAQDRAAQTQLVEGGQGSAAGPPAAAASLRSTGGALTDDQHMAE